MTSNLKIDDFELLKLIGKGSFSNVYKVKLKGTSYIYALKKVSIDDISNKEKAFNEIKLISKIKNEYVISFIDSFLDNNNNILYILMEYAPYGDLEKLIKEQKTKNKYYITYNMLITDNSKTQNNKISEAYIKIEELFNSLSAK